MESDTEYVLKIFLKINSQSVNKSTNILPIAHNFYTVEGMEIRV